MQEHGYEKMLIILVGNKSDLEDQRQVQTEEGEAFAKRNDLIFFETSAKASAGVEETFVRGTKHIYQGILNNKYDMDGEAIGIKVGNTPLAGSTGGQSGATLRTGETKKETKDGCCK